MGDARDACRPNSSTVSSPIHTFVLATFARSGLLDSKGADLAQWLELQLVCRAWRDAIAGVVLARDTLLVTHAQCARHHIPRRAERPERLRVVMDRLRERFPRVHVSECFAPATIAQLTRFHSDVHVDSLHKLAAKIERSMAALDALETPQEAATSNGSVDPNGAKPRNGFAATEATQPCAPSSRHFRTRPDNNSKPKGRAAYYAQFEFIDLDDDTILMRHTLGAALLAAGGVCHAVDRVLATKENPRRPRNAFCVVRPPGHHAEPQKAMGFCFFNNIGVAAFHALDAYALSRVAIIDFDVHHGNGTQRRVETEPRLLYVSLHQSPLYPHSGFVRETGQYDNIVNIPLPARSAGALYRQKFHEIVWPRVTAFAPQLILVSAGFDGHASDPLSDMKLQASDFYWLTNEITKMAWHSSEGRVVSVLEGGYHAMALADSAEQHVLALVHGSVQDFY